MTSLQGLTADSLGCLCSSSSCVAIAVSTCSPLGLDLVEKMHALNCDCGSSRMGPTPQRVP